MMNIFGCGSAEGRQYIEKTLKRSQLDDPEAQKAVDGIIRDVRDRGDAAVFGYTEQFDGVRLDGASVRVTRNEIGEAYGRTDPELLAVIKRAADRIRTFHEKQRTVDGIYDSGNGEILGRIVRPVGSAGVYVPGGRAAYPSSVLMNAVPAKVAGVEKIVMTTPPDRHGNIEASVIAAAVEAGVSEIYKVGGAQAVAALAYGTESVPQVDKIVGPGNIYVATAKKLVFGTVDIDMIAGPSEVLVIADDSAEPRYIAADMLAQAEHDVLASAILLTTSRQIAEETLAELERQLALLPRREIAGKSLADFGAVVVCDDIKQCIALSEQYAPEHLELCVRDPLSYVGLADNAGSVFLGHNTPESLGDYYAGPNHVLPTGGTARFFSPLGVDAFLKKSSFIYYTEPALKSAAGDVMTLARTEGLDAHANAVQVRL